MRDPGTNRPRLVRGNRYLERKGFSLSAEFYFIDGRTGQTPAQGEVHGGGPLRRGAEDLAALVVLRADGPAAPELPGRHLAPEDPRHARPPPIGATDETCDRPPRRVRARLLVASLVLLLLAAAAPAPRPVRPLLREEQGQLRQLRLARLQEPALRGLLLPRVRAAPGAASSSYAGERVPEGLGRPEARDPTPRSRVILYKTHSEFEQTNLFPDFVPEGVLAFAEPVRGRMVLPIDEPPDKLQGLITHELTHVFEFDIIPRSLVQRTCPLWLDEGLADYMRGHLGPARPDDDPRRRGHRPGPALSPLRRTTAASRTRASSTTSATPPSSSSRRATARRASGSSSTPSARTSWAAGIEDIYKQAFRIKPEEFDEAFDKWLKERFKPFRDKQRPSDYGKDLSPNPEKTTFTPGLRVRAQPLGRDRRRPHRQPLGGRGRPHPALRQGRQRASRT